MLTCISCQPPEPSTITAPLTRHRAAASAHAVHAWRRRLDGRLRLPGRAARRWLTYQAELARLDRHLVDHAARDWWW